MISIFPNIFHEDMNLVANFISKMSKLFGEVGRVDRRIFVQTYFCPYQGTRQVGQTHFGHMSKISQGFFGTLSLDNFEVYKGTIAANDLKLIISKEGDLHTKWVTSSFLKLFITAKNIEKKKCLKMIFLQAGRYLLL